MSQSIALTVQLNKPCQENWNNMTPTEQGRFCSKCEKQVVDFTGFTDQQLLQYFLANPFPVCGRLRSSQRDQTIVAAPPKINRSLSPVAAATLLTLTAISSEATAHNAPHPVFIHQLPSTNKPIASTPTDSVIISGTVVDGKGVPIENAEIVFGELKLRSDKDGNFKFPLPAGIDKPAVIKFSYGKLEPQVRSYHPAMGTTNYVVMLSYDVQFTIYGGGIAPIFTMLHLPDPVSTLSFQTSNKLDKTTKDFLSKLALFMKNQPDLRFSLRSWYKTNPKKAATLVKLVKNYLVDAEGVDESRFLLPHPKHKKQLTSEVIIEFGEPEPEE